MTTYPEFGGTTLPVTALADGAYHDEAQDLLLSFSAAVIRSALDATWPTGVSVADQLPWEPDKNLFGQRVAGWPLLLLWRSGDNELTQEATTTYTDTWTLMWCIGPCSGDDAMKLGPARMYAFTALLGAYRNMAHPSVADGVAVLKSYFGRIKVKSWDLANMFSEDGVMYPVLTMKIATTEMLTWNTDEVATIGGLMVFQGDDELVVSEAG